MTEALEAVGDRLAPLVRSTANPETLLLLLVRSVLQSDDELRALLVRFRSENKPVGWLRDMLAPRVAVHVDTYPFDSVIDVCQFVADEYQQLGEGYFIVSQDTGRVVFVASEDDLYDPGLLSRESGTLGQALRRLNPNLESALVLHHYDRARETDVLALIAGRLPQTDLLRDEGDRRLRVASRAGRTGIARELADDHPATLLRRAGGTTGMFLRHFPLMESEQPELGWIRVEGVATCRTSLGIQDVTTLNLGYDRLGVLRGVVPQAWIRDIARQLSYQIKVRSSRSLPLSVADLTEELIASEQLWVADPDVYALLRPGTVIPVEGAETIGFSGNAGALVVAPEFRVESRESGDRWQVTTTVEYQLYVDLQKVRFLPIVGIPHSAGIL